MKRKRKYGKLSLDQKVQIIRAAEMGYSQRTLASQYNCGKTQVHLLVTQKDLWLAKWERSRKGDSWSRLRGIPSISEINSLVWDFYKKACSHDIDVSVTMLLERAKQVAQALNVLNFDADLDWLEKFKREFNVTLPLPVRVSEDVQSKDDNAEHLPSELEKRNVYYFGVTELYHRTLPCIGQKSQDHITMCFCFNAEGDKEIISLVFCENACAEGELWNVSVPCFSSPMGQVTLEVYQHSLNVFNQKMNQLDRKIRLYVDSSQFPSEVDRIMSNIDIHECPWPFNVQEVINNYRLLYCQRLMSFLAASNLDEWSNIGQKVQSLRMSKIMRIVQSAWKQVSSKLIQLSFQNKAELTGRESECENINQELLEEIQKLLLLIKPPNDQSDLCLLDNVSHIAEEILSQDNQDNSTKEHPVMEDGEKQADQENEMEDVLPPSRSEVFPTILKLEMFLQSVPDSTTRHEALELLEKLERTMQDLLIVERTLEHEEPPDKIVPLDS